MGEVHQLLLDLGRDEVLKKDFNRPVIDAAAAYLASEDGEIGYLYSGWAQSALPHKKVPDAEPWQVRTEHITLIVQPGLRPCPTGSPAPLGVPYGSRARLILIYLQTEALRTNSREVELGKTLHAWLRKLEIPIGGKSMAAVRDQAERISRCRMTFQISQGSRVGLVNQNILDASMFVDDDSTRETLFIEHARLSELFFEHLRKHPVPIEEAAVRQIANNSMAIDVYCWLAYRLHSLKEPKLISWKALHTQFGRGLARLDQFRWYFKQPLELALAVYPDAKVAWDGRGLTLSPSRPPVAPKVISLAGRRRT